VPIVIDLQDRRPGSEEEGAWAEMDDAFMVKVLSGVEARLGEDWVRAMFHQYTQVRTCPSISYQISRM
jgi:hypothetical protein